MDGSCAGGTLTSRGLSAHLLAAQGDYAGGAVPVQQRVYALAAVAQHIPVHSGQPVVPASHRNTYRNATRDAGIAGRSLQGGSKSNSQQSSKHSHRSRGLAEWLPTHMPMTPYQALGPCGMLLVQYAQAHTLTCFSRPHSNLQPTVALRPGQCRPAQAHSTTRAQPSPGSRGAYSLT